MVKSERLSLRLVVKAKSNKPPMAIWLCIGEDRYMWLLLGIEKYMESSAFFMAK